MNTYKFMQEIDEMIDKLFGKQKDKTIIIYSHDYQKFNEDIEELLDDIEQLKERCVPVSLNIKRDLDLVFYDETINGIKKKKKIIALADDNGFQTICNCIKERFSEETSYLGPSVDIDFNYRATAEIGYNITLNMYSKQQSDFQWLYTNNYRNKKNTHTYVKK